MSSNLSTCTSNLLGKTWIFQSPDAAMVFMLLASCNLPDKEVQLVMSAIQDVTYVKIKSAIKRIYVGEIGPKVGSESSSVEVKSV